MTHPNEQIMARAIQTATRNYKRGGGSAVAAIIVKDDEIIAEAYTTINESPRAYAAGIFLNRRPLRFRRPPAFCGGKSSSLALTRGVLRFV